ncbi:unnamed protein product, partial [Adineta ricciae]
MLHCKRKLKTVSWLVCFLLILDVVIHHVNQNIKQSNTQHSILQTSPSVRSLKTTVECVGPSYNQSCLYQNLYYTKQGFLALSLKEDNLTLPGVRLAALATTEYRPRHLIFDTYEKLHQFVRSENEPRMFSGLTIHFNQLWHGNVGHALFDGLYPAYIAAIRFAPKHLQPFRVLVGFDKSQCQTCFSEDIYSRFAGLGLIKSNVLDVLAQRQWFVFEEIILGSGMMCQRCIQSNYQLAGGVELDGSRLFRDRMYKQHGLLPPHIRRNHSAERRDVTKPLNAYIVHNKRFTSQEQEDLKLAMDEINNYTDLYLNKSIDEIRSLRNPLVRVFYLDYRNITAQNNVSVGIDATAIDSKSPTYELLDNN